MKKILITGGTGFIGKPLSEALIAAGYSLYLLTRQKSLPNQTNKTYINNLKEIADLQPEIIINLAGESIAQRWTAKTKKTLYSSRISTTKDLVAYIKTRNIKPQVFITGSAVGYYGTEADTTLDETHSNPHPEVAFSSYLCNEWEEAAKIDLGIRQVFLRIGPVLAKDGGMLAKLLPSFSLGLGGQIGDGNQWLSWIDREDLIKLILFILDREDLTGPINATAPNPVINKNFSKALATALKRPCFMKTPAFILKLIFGQMAEELMLKGQRVVPKKALDHGFKFSCNTIEESLKKSFGDK